MSKNTAQQLVLISPNSQLISNAWVWLCFFVCGPLLCECNCAGACVRHTRMHISKTRQLLGLLNFCLLSRAESEMERIDLLSTGGALPWAGPLACSLAWLPCRGLSFSSYTNPLTRPSFPLSLSPSLPLSLSLHGGCLSSSWHLSCRYWERCALSCWHQDWSSSFPP